MDLNKKYEWKPENTGISIYPAKMLTYVINNAEKDITFEFKYNKNMDLYPDVEVPNPFEVCHGDDCKENIETYDFKKGESYKIYAKVKEVRVESINRSVFPSYSFYGKKEEGPVGHSFNLRLNIWFIYFLLLFI